MRRRGTLAVPRLDLALPVFNVRLDPDLAARFDRAAAERGGRSACLRQIIRDAAARDLTPTRSPKTLRTDRVMVRLTSVEAAGVDREAAAMSLSRAGWITALVRRRVSSKLRFSAEGDAALRAVQADLRRLAVNLNQIARSRSTSGPTPLSERDNSILNGLAEQIRRQHGALKSAFVGNLDYWSVSDG